MNAQTEKLLLQGEAGAIEAQRDVPAGAAPRGVVVIAHPHPLFGGTMDNKVVQTLARAFVQCGWSAVRFNFRGVGASAGVHDEGRAERLDMLAVLRQVAPEGPIALAGFSFGAAGCKSAANTPFLPKSKNRNPDTLCIKITVLIWWSIGDSNP